MADKFPMSLRQLIPVLDVIGRANKYLARVGKFLQKYGEMDLFPVKLQVCGLDVNLRVPEYKVQACVCRSMGSRTCSLLKL